MICTGFKESAELALARHPAGGARLTTHGAPSAFTAMQQRGMTHHRAVSSPGASLRLCGAPARRRRTAPPPPSASKGFGAKRVPPKQAAAETEDAEQLNVDLGVRAARPAQRLRRRNSRAVTAAPLQRGKSLQLLRTRDLLDTGGAFVSSQAIHRRAAHPHTPPATLAHLSLAFSQASSVVRRG